MKTHIYLPLLLISLLKFNFINAQTGSPKSLNINVDLTSCNCTAFPGPSGYFNSNAQVVSAINFARRAEEVQFSFANGALGTFVLPPNYSTISDSQKGLYIINSERVARAGMNYGSGAVLGLPLQGVDQQLNALAQAHTQNMQTNNYFNHSNVAAGEPDAYVRIENKFGTQKEFNTRAENIYASCGGYNTHVVEQAIFSWLYRDASSAWGHRAAIFIQNTDPISNGNGYDDNFGPSGSEGFIGFGVLRDVSFVVVCGAPRLSAEILTPYKTNNPNLIGNVVTMIVIDPSPTFIATPLPVTLIAFNLKKNENNVELIWKTSTETNNIGYNIEKSTDGKEFKKIGFVTGKINTNELTTYNFIDEYSGIGQLYYRLKQLDLNGKYEFSPVKSIFIENEELSNLVLSPNPVQSILKIKGIEGNSTIEIMDLKGKQVYFKFESYSSFNEAEINLDNIPNDIYILQIKQNGKSKFKKIIVNR